jgi:hypothetical protein
MIPSRFDNKIATKRREARRRRARTGARRRARPGALVALVAAHLLLALGPLGLQAQQELPVGGVGPFLRFELAKPLFDEGPFYGSHFATTAGDLNLVVPVNGTLSLYGSVSYAVGEIEERGWSAAISNARIGASLGRRGSIHGRAHVDLPIATEISDGYATGVARYTFFEEFERYATDSWAVGGSVTAEDEMSPGAYVGARLGGSLVLPMGDDVDKDAYGTFEVFGDAPAGAARLLFELSAVALLTEPELHIDQVTAFFGTLSVSLPNYPLAPEAYARVSIDDTLGDLVRFVLGVRAHIGNTRYR